MVLKNLSQKFWIDLCQIFTAPFKFFRNQYIMRKCTNQYNLFIGYFSMCLFRWIGWAEGIVAKPPPPGIFAEDRQCRQSCWVSKLHLAVNLLLFVVSISSSWRCCFGGAGWSGAEYVCSCPSVFGSAYILMRIQIQIKLHFWIRISIQREKKVKQDNKNFKRLATNLSRMLLAILVRTRKCFFLTYALPV